MGRQTKVLYSYQIEFLARIADRAETTCNEYTPECADCDDYVGTHSAYRMNGHPINPRAGRAAYIGEKLDADLNG